MHESIKTKFKSQLFLPDFGLLGKYLCDDEAIFFLKNLKLYKTRSSSQPALHVLFANLI